MSAWDEGERRCGLGRWCHGPCVRCYIAAIWQAWWRTQQKGAGTK